MSKAARVRSLPAPGRSQSPPETRGPARGTLVGLTERGEVQVRLPDGSVRTSLLATAFSDRLLVQAIRHGAEVLVQFLEGEPVIVGLLRTRVEVDPEIERPLREAHVVVEAKQSLTLACGETAIELHADGRVSIRGKHVASISSGPHLVEGSPVRIN